MQAPFRSSFAAPSGRTFVSLWLGDVLDVLSQFPDCCVTAVVTDPPYGAFEYAADQVAKLRAGTGGIWRQPPKGRSPLPRFTTLSADDKTRMYGWMSEVAAELHRVLVPGGHMFMAANPLLSSGLFAAIEASGFEKRGEVVRTVRTLRGGDRPKGSEGEYRDISVMPRSCWEPWGIFRKPMDCSTVAANLRRWGTGGLRRISDEQPFSDMIPSHPASASERKLAPHPSLKPQAFLRQVVRAALPEGGVVLDPFAGSGSTLAAAAACGVDAYGIERDAAFFEMAVQAVPRLAMFAPAK